MNAEFKSLYLSDCQRNTGGGYVLRLLWLLRLASTTKNWFIRTVCAKVLHYYKCKYGLEIQYTTRIGKGLYLGHAYNITINPKAIIGNYCNIHKGATIGQENRGHRKGVPTIGNYVYIGVNATISGNIVIGDDVMIGPNCHVNQDIPPHSVVFGNPCIVKHRDHATENYISSVY